MILWVVNLLCCFLEFDEIEINKTNQAKIVVVGLLPGFKCKADYYVLLW